LKGIIDPAPVLDAGGDGHRDHPDDLTAVRPAPELRKAKLGITTSAEDA
jgi:hypothetical protein